MVYSPRPPTLWNRISLLRFCPVEQDIPLLLRHPLPSGIPSPNRAGQGGRRTRPPPLSAASPPHRARQAGGRTRPPHPPPPRGTGWFSLLPHTHTHTPCLCDYGHSISQPPSCGTGWFSLTYLSCTLVLQQVSDVMVYSPPPPPPCRHASSGSPLGLEASGRFWGGYHWGGGGENAQRTTIYIYI